MPRLLEPGEIGELLSLVHDDADRLARHERAHHGQIAHTVDAVRT
jgi:hypothetical protein